MMAYTFKMRTYVSNGFLFLSFIKIAVSLGNKGITTITFTRFQDSRKQTAIIICKGMDLDKLSIFLLF